ncbi:MAG TPA: hypothetical protein VFP91_14005 [Vicinamibacterales bacterium]|nr:hypothetical protein [Vicinamibacterales bacterium]
MESLLRRMVPVLAIVCGTAVGHAQWLGYPAPGVPRLPDGKVNLSAKAPRTRDGKPDLSGVWRTELESIDGKQNAFVVPGDDPRTFSKYFLNILADFKPDDLPMRPSAVEAMRKNREQRLPGAAARCLPLGLPMMDVFAYSPFKMIQSPGMLVVLYEMDNAHRQIYIDGRKLPVDPQPTWGGYSVGRWEGDTLVVDAAGFNDRTRLDSGGHPHTEQMHLQERFHRRDFGHMDLTVTVDDPEMYTKPLSYTVTEVLLPDSDVLETVCNENEKDLAHLR